MYLPLFWQKNTTASYFVIVNKITSCLKCCFTYSWHYFQIFVNKDTRETFASIIQAMKKLILTRRILSSISPNLMCERSGDWSCEVVISKMLLLFWLKVIFTYFRIVLDCSVVESWKFFQECVNQMLLHVFAKLIFFLFPMIHDWSERNPLLFW